jgi:hypothetical protein
MSGPRCGQARASLGDFEPKLLDRRQKKRRADNRSDLMFTFQLIGLLMLALFFGAMINSSATQR